MNIGATVTPEQLKPGDIVNIKGNAYQFQGDKSGKALFTKRDAGGLTYKGAEKKLSYDEKITFLRHAIPGEFQNLHNCIVQNASAPLGPKSLMPMGQYKGRTMDAVPSKYLIYLYDKGYLKNERVRTYVLNNLAALRADKRNMF